MKYASAGTLESNDCLITVEPSKKMDITIESIVFEQFGDQIHAVIESWLLNHGLTLFVHIQDKGALDYTIIARLTTAVKRLEANHA
ncbi:MAG: citrate lyase acyl carrier protein [Acholeplasma sp.]|jgi:citrate lyase subunit gamma (acyl carrier protein)|nr:MAG: citrate lyase acyl carrier protein [Acholeplasma sp.]